VKTKAEIQNVAFEKTYLEIVKRKVQHCFCYPFTEVVFTGIERNVFEMTEKKLVISVRMFQNMG